jgi:hypothetical protein
MSVHPSVRPHGTTLLPFDWFSWNLIFEYFRKSVKKIQVSLKSDKNKGYFTWSPIYVLYRVKRMRILYCHVWPVRLHHIFLHYLIYNKIFGKKGNAHKIVFWFSLQLLSVTFAMLKRIQQIIIIYIHGSPCKVSVVLVRF